MPIAGATRESTARGFTLSVDLSLAELRHTYVGVGLWPKPGTELLANVSRLSCVRQSERVRARE